MIFGCDPRTPLILGFLGYTRDDFGRFLDAFPNSGKYIVIARIASDPNYKWVFEKIANHPLFEGWSEGPDAQEIIFHFAKPDADYVLPATFVQHFEGYQEAANAVFYLNNCQDRPLNRTVVG